MAITIFINFAFTALHKMQTRSSDENSVRLSLRLSKAWIVTKKIVGYGMYSHRIFLIKLIFSCSDSVRVRLSENKRVHIFPLSSPFCGVISVSPPPELTMYIFPPFANNF